MKKLLGVCLSLVMVFSLTMTAFAAPGGFVSSPSGNPAPQLVDYDNGSEDCDAEIKITPYSQRDTLDAASREKLEEAYEQIVNMANGNNFSAALAKLAKEKNVNVENLSVSDLFDMSWFNCTEHEEHKGFTITLKFETMAKFVGLLHFNDGAWDIVEVSGVDKEENTITFYIEDFSPFAVVVDTGVQTPQTGDTSMIYLWIGLAAASGLILIFIVVKKKKTKKEEV